MKPTLLEIEQAVAAINPAPWRVVFDEGDLVIYFHADLLRDPLRIVISDSDPPSPNEYAVAAFLVDSREMIRTLCERVHELEHALTPNHPIPSCACACHTYQGTYPTSKARPCWVCGHYEERP